MASALPPPAHEYMCCSYTDPDKTCGGIVKTCHLQDQNPALRECRDDSDGQCLHPFLSSCSHQLEDTLELVKLIESTGVAAIAVHGRWCCDCRCLNCPLVVRMVPRRAQGLGLGPD